MTAVLTPACNSDCACTCTSTPTLHSELFTLNTDTDAAHPHDQFIAWITDHQLTHLSVITDDHRVCAGEIEIVREPDLAPSQVEHVAVVHPMRVMVVTSRVSFTRKTAPAQRTFINPRIQTILGHRF